mmetsp:Transcript_422/g.750  ORF Transcript_422/g.750 Transcript_422/m.750 type:complete len:147 (+) Transcript_422:2174-2614(+)
MGARSLVQTTWITFVPSVLGDSTCLRSSFIDGQRFLHVCKPRCRSPYGTMEPPPLENLRTLQCDYPKILALAEAGVRSAQEAGMRYLTVDFPPPREETRAGTLVRRFEMNVTFAKQLATRLTDERGGIEVVGEQVEIRDNIKYVLR